MPRLLRRAHLGDEALRLHLSECIQASHRTHTLIGKAVFLPWVASRSADVYEFSTETLFFGRQDSMQRSALLPLHQYMLDNGLDPSRLRLLELGCGTGRFHTFIKVGAHAYAALLVDCGRLRLVAGKRLLLCWVCLFLNQSHRVVEWPALRVVCL